MVHGTSKSGFSLVELMVTSAISTVILGAVASSFVGGIRLLKITFATAEMSVQVRELRDRLLFHAAPSYGGTVYAGLLSGTNVLGGVSGLRMDCTVLNGSGGDTKSQKIDLTFKDWGEETCSIVNNRCSNGNWLRPGNMGLFAESSSTAPITWAHGGVYTNTVSAVTNNIDSRFYVHITGRMNVSGLPVVHNERIVVPVFGHVQSTHQNGQGGLDE